MGHRHVPAIAGHLQLLPKSKTQLKIGNLKKMLILRKKQHIQQMPSMFRNDKWLTKDSTAQEN